MAMHVRIDLRAWLAPWLNRDAAAASPPGAGIVTPL